LRSIVLPAETPFGTAMNIPTCPDAQELQRSRLNESQEAPTAQSLSGLRLRKHADYERAYAASRKRQSASMSWFVAKRQADGGDQRSSPRVGLTAGKVLGKAHERNRIKRLMREVLRRHVDLLPHGCDLIFHPRRIVLSIEFAKLEAEVVRILRQANAEAAKTIADGSRSSVSRVKPTP
jgi:ribonuclease P protein component